MEIFSEIYGNYYKAVEQILRTATVKPLTIEDMRGIISEYAFADSSLYILPKLTGGSWPLIKKSIGNETTDYESKLRLPDKLPLTTLQKSWLKSILNDPRIKLFLDDENIESLINKLDDTLPLYDINDFFIYDSAADGDDYTNLDYRRNFKVIMKAIREKEEVKIKYASKRGKRASRIFSPYKMEYSPKDDKFRVLCHSDSKRTIKNYILNMNRIEEVSEIVDGNFSQSPTHDPNSEKPIEKFKYHRVKFEITEERNALERVMVQFSNYEKSTVYDEASEKYTCTMKYNSMDETEVLIMLLSFGPTIKITGPGRFLSLFKERIKKEWELLEPKANA